MIRRVLITAGVIAFLGLLYWMQLEYERWRAHIFIEEMRKAR